MAHLSVAVLSDVVAYNGGRPLSCHALAPPHLPSRARQVQRVHQPARHASAAIDSSADGG